MDIAALSTALSQNNVQQTAAVQVQKLAMNSMKAQGATVAEMLSNVITDPALGTKVDFLA